MKFYYLLFIFLFACSSEKSKKNLESLDQLIISESTKQGVLSVDPEKRVQRSKEDVDTNLNSNVQDFLVEETGETPIALKGQPSNAILVSYLTQGYLQMPKVTEGESGYDDAFEKESSLKENRAITQMSMTNSRASIAQEVDSVAVAMDADSPKHEAYSGTNTQVEGVDEGDIWKYDGTYFFVLSKKNYLDFPIFPSSREAELEVDAIDQIVNQAFPLFNEIRENDLVTKPSEVNNTEDGEDRICTEDTCAKLRIVHKNKTELSSILLNDIAPEEMYLDDDQLILIGNQFISDNIWADYQQTQLRRIQLQVFDVSKKDEIENSLKVSLDGQKVRSRRIGDDVYIISRYTPYIKDLVYRPYSKNTMNNNLKILESTASKDLLPKITIDNVQQELISAENCWLTVMPKTRWGASTLTIITRLNIKTGDFTSRCLGGNIEGIYMSQKSLYLYNTSYQPHKIEPRLKSRVGIWNWTEGNTHIHKFLLEGLSYQGSVLADGVVGHQHASFRFGELKDNTLGVVTTKNEWRNPEHRLSLFDQIDGEWQLKTLLPNDVQPSLIGKPGERIYSVRFMQDRAYIVTFQQTDPLYVIDLSDSNFPKIAGELEISGFSDYLHPIGSNLLIGVGKEAKQNSYGATINLGVKVTLFDVSDITNTIEAGNLIIGMRGSSSLLSSNHLAFSGIQQAESYRFAFPIHVHEGIDYYVESGGAEFAYHRWLHSGLYLFEVKDNTLSIAGALITDQKSESTMWNGFEDARGLIQGDDVFHLKDSQIYKANWLNLDDTTEGPF